MLTLFLSGCCSSPINVVDMYKNTNAFLQIIAFYKSAKCLVR